MENDWVFDPMDGFICHVGGLWIRQKEGQCEFGFLAKQIHANRNGVVHGGMIMTFIDRAFGKVARESSGALRGATINLSVNFTNPVQLGKFVTLVPKITHVTSRTAFLEGTALCNDQVVAAAQGVWRVVHKH